MLNLYLMRHGQTEFNQQGLIQGWADSPLTDAGKAGIVQAAQEFAANVGVRFDAAFCSTLARTEATARLFLHTLHQDDLPIITLANLREYHFGSFEQHSSHELHQRLAHENGFDNVDDWLHAYRYGTTHLLAQTVSRIDPAQQAESEAAFNARLQHGLQDIIDHQAHGNVLAVSHGMAITALLKQINPQAVLYQSLANASISHLSYTPTTGWQIQQIGKQPAL